MIDHVLIEPDRLVDLIRQAYLAGCEAVQADYHPDPDPEFGEAADDYAASLDFTEDTRPARALLFPARAALVKIARMRTELSGDFSMSSRQSDIAREALDVIGLGDCLTCETPLMMGPFGAVDCPACNPDPARG